MSKKIEDEEIEQVRKVALEWTIRKYPIEFQLGREREIEAWFQAKNKDAEGGGLLQIGPIISAAHAKQGIEIEK